MKIFKTQKTMKIKYLLLICLLAGINAISFGQQKNTPFDKKLLVKFSVEYLQKLQTENPDSLEFLNYAVNYGFYFTDVSKNKPVSTQKLMKINPQTKSEQEIISFEDIEADFNPLLYNCVLSPQNQTYFSIGNTGKILVMRSKSSLMLRYKSYKTEHNLKF